MASNDDAPTTLSLAEHADKLPAYLNTILIQIGKLFRQHANPDQKIMDQLKTQTHDVMIKTTRQYHESLDQIEFELNNARAVFNRELDRIRTLQAEREQALRTVAAEAEPRVAAAEDTIMNEVHQSTENQDSDDVAIGLSSGQNEHIPLSLDESVPDAPIQNHEQADPNAGQPLGDDLFGDGDFGPIDETTQFDFGNDLDFSNIPMDESNITTNDEAPTTNANIPATAAPITATEIAPSDIPLDNDTLMQDFGDLNGTDSLNTNDFGDDIFGSMHDVPDASTETYDPLDTNGNTTTEDFDSWFNDM